ncbi:SRPBCC family protein [Sphingomonas sp. SRS2]|uniref:SRPBCC family protein n=1 Tax=Sphingomonas sp. SRS2 TaxID=133190 RepID=UPI000618455C|nr:SRPBCC family protein [Sphingomonas sp. SRS2]KKC26020.1 hypothetical protein WP12_10365 [Sphingomonas sp. SRS2]
MKYVRGTAHFTGDVAVSADAFWTMLRDWPAVMKWTPTEDKPAPLLNVTLKDGDDVNMLPCTRIMHFDTSTGFPPTFEETLLYAYPEARRIFYTFNGVPDGLTNYMATTFVDALSETSARVTCSAMFDVADAASLEDTVTFLENVYERSIIRGIERAVQRERG